MKFPGSRVHQAGQEVRAIVAAGRGSAPDTGRATDRTMITAAQIETNPAAFVTRCLGHVAAGLYPQRANGYRDFLIDQTPDDLNDYFQRIDRSPGTQRTFVDADHIIPQNSWPMLMPAQLTTDDRYVSVLGNLAWRSTEFNRRDDHTMIQQVAAEYPANPRGSPGWQAWADGWIEMFTAVKQQEGNPLAGYYVDPAMIDRLDPDLQRVGYTVTRGRLRT